MIIKLRALAYSTFLVHAAGTAVVIPIVCVVSILAATAFLVVAVVMFRKYQKKKEEVEALRNRRRTGDANEHPKDEVENNYDTLDDDEISKIYKVVRDEKGNIASSNDVYYFRPAD